MDQSTEYGIVVMLTAYTLGMMLARVKSGKENNWITIYWLVMLLAAVRIEYTWEYLLILGGLVTSLMLRFEFISHSFETAFRTIEFLFFGYVLYRSYQLLMA